MEKLVLRFIQFHFFIFILNGDSPIDSPQGPDRVPDAELLVKPPSIVRRSAPPPEMMAALSRLRNTLGGGKGRARTLLDSTTDTSGNSARGGDLAIAMNPRTAFADPGQVNMEENTPTTHGRGKRKPPPLGKDKR
jgi:hypothetical protein